MTERSECSCGRCECERQRLLALLLEQKRTWAARTAGIPTSTRRARGARQILVGSRHTRRAKAAKARRAAKHG